MGFRLLGRDQKSEASVSSVNVTGTMHGSAARLRDVVAATDQAVDELERVVQSQKPSQGEGSKPDRSALEAELAKSLLVRAQGFRNEASELLQILERAVAKLGPPPGDPGTTSTQGAPFARRSTDPGGAERLRGAPPSTWRGPERRRPTPDEKMTDHATGNGNPLANEGAN